MNSSTAQSTLEQLKENVYNSVKGQLCRVEPTGDELMFHEHDISSPIQTPNEDGNFSSTISGMQFEEGEILFTIDSSYSDNVVNSDEISLENLIYILGAIESIETE